MSNILAFPQGNEWMDAEGNMRLIHQGGMTLRDYFAAAALQGMMSNAGYNNSNSTTIVAAAWLMADTMVIQRKG